MLPRFDYLYRSSWKRECWSNGLKTHFQKYCNYAPTREIYVMFLCLFINIFCQTVHHEVKC